MNRSLRLIEKIKSSQEEIITKLTNIQDLIDLHPDLEDFYRDSLVFLTLLYRNYVVYNSNNVILHNNGKIIKLKGKFPKEDSVDYKFAKEYIYGSFDNIKRPDDPNYIPPSNNLFNVYDSLQSGAWLKDVGKAKCIITFDKSEKFNHIFDIEITCCPRRRSIQR